ncbi:hypothetical protein M441DRAFT_34074 [Trichoderma asperellum CBS 433.97]|uniref:Uncharacterized protein n=1 Tax=Trichoderma asperellum (strain ATCC 204424 / CBS 433.97 / NBRC 101777) TaxID=1042311 RepID=A0A2T3ZKR1_TRIA4|nr:hypothetical protein M441DRAFT_34074 [Trichoderma asperellum CBS 433.97]PTB45395.1 hypothetical protein M441DRAFT_34074 [Trichoderma asperellum CBS 433.97]
MFTYVLLPTLTNAIFIASLVLKMAFISYAWTSMPGSTTTAFQCANTTSFCRGTLRPARKGIITSSQNMHFFFFFFAHVAGIGWRWHSSFLCLRRSKLPIWTTLGKKV